MFKDDNIVHDIKLALLRWIVHVKHMNKQGIVKNLFTTKIYGNIGRYRIRRQDTSNKKLVEYCLVKIRIEEVSGGG